MGKNKNQRNGNQQVNNNQQDQKKPGVLKRLVTWPKRAAQRHPKIAKGMKIGVTVVGGTLAAVGGAGLTMAIKERYGKPVAPDLPEMPSMPDIRIPEPGPEYPTDD